MSRLVSADKQDFSVHFPSNLLSFPCNRKKYRSVYEFRRIRTHFPPSKRSAFSSRWNNSGYKWIVITLAEPHPPYLDLASDTNLTPVALTNSTVELFLSLISLERSLSLLTFDLLVFLLIWWDIWNMNQLGFESCKREKKRDLVLVMTGWQHCSLIATGSTFTTNGNYFFHPSRRAGSVLI